MKGSTLLIASGAPPAIDFFLSLPIFAKTALVNRIADGVS